ncbi:hypothetical protein DSCO28_51760 [Desulfosarcina ovata subsp. sediminis]|uniref:Uncharacterized protein n=1 Tax=Desulfosarcina ovata subsp. sediminis TaxID=885957 RepID=A0A5K7ZWX7_9BACT|nr:hypothetical protein [Desulfosarcina ovata]BBO84610.1 hypothetical protein DSCO28_51760 [Desulfosarcina ovata subsp. sediminis]
MKTMAGAVFFLFGLLAATAWADLTGRWTCNDGGTYYLREQAGQIYWYAEAKGTPPAWATVFSGRMVDGAIEGHWINVPKGRATGSGELKLVVEKDGQRLRAVERSSGFKGSRWTRLDSAAHASSPLTRLKPSAGEDCVQFDPARTGVQQVSGRWKITDGAHWLFDFGNNAAAARKALDVIRHYRMDRACFVGRPQPAFTYMLAKGGVPTGAMTGEDCVAFDTGRLTVSKIQGRWKIVSGRRWLFDFGNNESEARAALAIIRRYRFNQACYVGRPKADFSYLRR